jgi:hypothetical protein
MNSAMANRMCNRVEITPTELTSENVVLDVVIYVADEVVFATRKSVRLDAKLTLVFSEPPTLPKE